MPHYTTNSEAVIKAALTVKTIAVVGLSPDPHRPSNEVAVYLLDRGYHVVGINPNCDEVLGCPCYATLTAVPHAVHTVDVFRQADAVPAIAAEAVAIGADFLWLQLDVISPEGIAIAANAGLGCVVDRCTKIEHARLMM